MKTLLTCLVALLSCHPLLATPPQAPPLRVPPQAPAVRPGGCPSCGCPCASGACTCGTSCQCAVCPGQASKAKKPVRWKPGCTAEQRALWESQGYRWDVYQGVWIDPPVAPVVQPVYQPAPVFTAPMMPSMPSYSAPPMSFRAAPAMRGGGGC